MGKGTPKRDASAGEEFVRPYTDLVTDLEREYGVYINVYIMLSGRRGVLEVACSARREADGLEARPICTVVKEWPHATVQSLPALLYNLLFKLGVMVEEDYNDRQRRLDIRASGDGRRPT